jgi:hypothetical protein
MADEKIKCAHEPCVCEVAPGQTYCSEYCERVATSQPPLAAALCRCGHSDCTA